jgi:fumarate reductase subunit D
MAKSAKIVSNLSSQASLALIGYIVLVITIMLPIDLYFYDQEKQSYVKVRYSFLHRLTMMLLMTLPIALSIYNINCLTSGKCNTWAWLVAAVAFLWVVLFVLQNFIYAIGNSG